MSNLNSYFSLGPRRTLSLTPGTNASYRGTRTPVYAGTEIDRWYVGDFSSASYTINVELDTSHKETFHALITGRPESANLVIFGRISTGSSLVALTVTVNDSWVSVVANPTNVSYEGARLSFTATYGETVTPLTGNSFTSGVTYSPFFSDFGFSSNGFNVDLSGNAQFDGTASINAVDLLTSLSFNGIDTLTSTTLGSTVINSSLTSVGTLTGLTVAGTTALTGQLTVTGGQIQLTSSTVGNINNVTIGDVTPAGATFTGVTADVITLTQVPTSANQVTTKKYVDSKVSALAIALGA